MSAFNSYTACTIFITPTYIYQTYAVTVYISLIKLFYAAIVRLRFRHDKPSFENSLFISNRIKKHSITADERLPYNFGGGRGGFRRIQMPVRAENISRFIFIYSRAVRRRKAYSSRGVKLFRIWVLFSPFGTNFNFFLLCHLNFLPEVTCGNTRHTS